MAIRQHDSVALSGRLNGRRAPEVREAVYARIDDGEGDVVVDLSEVESVDGSVVRVLAAAAVRLQRAGRHLILRGCPPSLRRVFTLGALRRVFVVERDA